MRWSCLLVIIAGIFSNPAARAAEETSALNSKIISQEMAVVWCKKMEECSTDKSMTVKECEKILYKSFKTGFDRLPKDQPIQLERTTLDECKVNVGKGSCDSLKTAKSLPACEFIGLLGK